MRPLKKQKCAYFLAVACVTVVWLVLQDGGIGPDKALAMPANQSHCWERYQRDIDRSSSKAFIPGRSVMMEPTSVKMLCGLLTPHTRVLEWGSGGSTLFFSQFVRRWDTIEHDTAWTLHMKTLVAGMPAVHLHAAAHSWNKIADGTYEQFTEYVDLPSLWGLQYDVILVDGRARVACVHAIARYNLIVPGGLVVVHDWERSEYKAVLGEFDLVQEDTAGPRHLGVLQLKQNNKP